MGNQFTLQDGSCARRVCEGARAFCELDDKLSGIDSEIVNLDGDLKKAVPGVVETTATMDEFISAFDDWAAKMSAYNEGVAARQKARCDLDQWISLYGDPVRGEVRFVVPGVFNAGKNLTEETIPPRPVDPDSIEVPVCPEAISDKFRDQAKKAFDNCVGVYEGLSRLLARRKQLVLARARLVADMDAASATLQKAIEDAKAKMQQAEIEHKREIEAARRTLEEMKKKRTADDAEIKRLQTKIELG